MMVSSRRVKVMALYPIGCCSIRPVCHGNALAIKQNAGNTGGTGTTGGSGGTGAGKLSVARCRGRL